MHLLSSELYIDMAKVGYIFKANSYDAFDADKEWMLQYGCVQVIEESVKHETLRPKWKQLMSNLERGDELVVSKFSNAVRGLRELAALIELCRIKVVRIISIHDKIDTCNELFADTTPAEVLMMFGALPEEVAVLRKSSDKIMRLQQSINTSILTKKSLSKAEHTSLMQIACTYKVLKFVRTSRNVHVGSGHGSIISEQDILPVIIRIKIRVYRITCFP